MFNLAAVILQFILGLFGYGKKADPAKEAGANEQKVTDISAAYDELAKAADARADADLERVRSDPAAAEIDPDPAKDHPNLRFRD